MSDASSGTASWRHYAIRAPISACLIQQEDLKRLYDIISEKQQEEATKILGLLVKQVSETDAQFEQRKVNVRNVYVTLVTINAPNGEAVTGNTRAVFDSASVPERIVSVLIDTANGPKSLGITPPNWASLFLDFRRPPLLNYGVVPSAPTPNESNYQINATAEAWATALDARIRDFFKQRATARGWLHKQGCYDGLLMFLGLPFTLWATYRAGPWFITGTMPTAIITAIYVYLFFVLLNLFRTLFSYTRWVFPLVELVGIGKNSTQGHRVFWFTIVSSLVIAVLAILITDVIKHFASQ